MWSHTYTTAFYKQKTYKPTPTQDQHPFIVLITLFPQKMLIPVRCFTCGNILADKWLAYEELVKRERQAKNDDRTEHYVIDDVKAFLARSDTEMKSAEGLAMDALGVTKMCCRRHMLTTVDSLEDI